MITGCKIKCKTEALTINAIYARHIYRKRRTVNSCGWLRMWIVNYRTPTGRICRTLGNRTRYLLAPLQCIPNSAKMQVRGYNSREPTRRTFPAMRFWANAHRLTDTLQTFWLRVVHPYHYYSSLSINNNIMTAISFCL